MRYKFFSGQNFSGQIFLGPKFLRKNIWGSKNFLRWNFFVKIFSCDEQLKNRRCHSGRMFVCPLFNDDKFWVIDSNPSFINFKVAKLGLSPSSGIWRDPLLFLNIGNIELSNQEMGYFSYYLTLDQKTYFAKYFLFLPTITKPVLKQEMELSK